MTLLRLNLCLFVLAVLNPLSSGAATGGAIVPLGLSNNLPANDDDSAGPVPLNIGGTKGINFFGQSFTQVYVNNNGNLTFSTPLGDFTPNGLATGVGQPIIAPFFADVDTEGDGSGLVTYGNATVQGLPAFVANYIGVGYYSERADKLNSFQVILLDRSDTGAGNFDIEFNYNQVKWETGEASDGTNGLGGVSAVAGFSNGLSGESNVYFQLPGSLVNGALLDGGPNSLIAGSMNSGVPGRYLFQVRNGVVSVTPPPPTGSPLTLLGDGNLGTFLLGSPVSGGFSASGGTPPYNWASSGTLPAGITASGSSIGGVPTQPGNYSVGLVVTDAMGLSVSGTLNFSVFGLHQRLTAGRNCVLALSGWRWRRRRNTPLFIYFFRSAERDFRKHFRHDSGYGAGRRSIPGASRRYGQRRLFDVRPTACYVRAAAAHSGFRDDASRRRSGASLLPEPGWRIGWRPALYLEHGIRVSAGRPDAAAGRNHRG